jgi:hypothetical protein
VDTPVARSADSETSVRDPERQVDTADEDVVKVPETPGALSRLRGFVTALRPAWKALGAYLIYQTMAFAIWVVPILSVFGREHIGTGLQDSRFYQWALEWTPWALSHGVNPLFASSVFAPTGVNMAWSAFVPGPALVAWPITAVFGPLASLNAWLAAAPALAAWAAYLVCNRLTHRFWASFAGGCLFGFSAYMGANIIGFINLVLVFPIPLLVYLAIRNVEGSLGPVAFVAGFAALLVGLFSISTELFGTATVFGAIAFLGALAFSKEIRRPLLRTGGLMLLSGAIAALLLLPYIHAIFVDAPDSPVRQADVTSADLASLIIPPPAIRAGGSYLEPTLESLMEYPQSNGQSYLGVAVLAMLVGFAITGRRRRSTWALLSFVSLSAILTLGPVLHIGGQPYGWLPERAFSHLPFLASAVPARLAVYSTLAVGVIAALWLAGSARRIDWIRWVIVLVVIASFIPFGPRHPASVDVPAFFSSPSMHDVIREGENVYVIPYQKGEEMQWQGLSGFWFKLAQGYIGPIPPALDSGQMADGLHLRKVVDIPSAQELTAWSRERGVSAFILDDRVRQKYQDLLIGAALVQVYSGGGVSVWRWPDEVSATSTVGSLG